MVSAFVPACGKVPAWGKAWWPGWRTSLGAISTSHRHPTAAHFAFPCRTQVRARLPNRGSLRLRQRLSIEPRIGVRRAKFAAKTLRTKKVRPPTSEAILPVGRAPKASGKVIDEGADLHRHQSVTGI